MAGTIQGAVKAKKTNLERHGEDFFQRIGVLGGQKKGVAKGFAAGEAGRARAIEAGKRGGKRSKRGKKNVV